MLPLFCCVLLIGTDPEELRIEKATVDRDEVIANKPLVQTFHVQNVSQFPIAISEISGSCACFKKEISNKKLDPGDKAILSIGINLLTQPEGPNRWTATVKYRVFSSKTEFTDREKMLVITAKVKKEVVIEPVSIVLSTDRDAATSIKVLDRRDRPLKIKSVRVGIEEVSSRIEVVDRDGKNQTQLIHLAISDKLKTGQHIDEVCIDTDDPSYSELRIPLRIIKKTAASGLVAAPEQVTIRFAKEQQTAAAIIRLKDSADRDVVIEKIESPDDAISTKWVAGPEKMSTIRLNLDRSKLRNDDSSSLIVHCKSPKGEILVIPVSWKGVIPIK